MNFRTSGLSEYQTFRAGQDVPSLVNALNAESNNLGQSFVLERSISRFRRGVSCFLSLLFAPPDEKCLTRLHLGKPIYVWCPPRYSRRTPTHSQTPTPTPPATPTPTP